MSPAEIFRDFRRNYNSCYILLQFPDKHEKHLFQITGIDESDHPQITVMSRHFGTLVLNLNSDYRIHFPTAIPGVFQSGKEAYYAVKHFGAGYSRGINSANTRFQTVLENINAAVEARTIDLLIEDMFAQHYMPLPECMKLLDNSDYRSCAIDRSFALSLSVVHKTGFTMYFRSNPVAELDRNGKIVAMHQEVYRKAVERIINAY